MRSGHQCHGLRATTAIANLLPGRPGANPHSLATHLQRPPRFVYCIMHTVHLYLSRLFTAYRHLLLILHRPILSASPPHVFTGHGNYCIRVLSIYTRTHTTLLLPILRAHRKYVQGRCLTAVISTYTYILFASCGHTTWSSGPCCHGSIYPSCDVGYAASFHRRYILEP